jgi:hypothetical protein
MQPKQASKQAGRQASKQAGRQPKHPTPCRPRTGDHLDVNAQLHGVLQGLLGVGARRVEEGEDAQHLPLALVVGLRDGEAADAAAAELHDLPVDALGHLLLVDLGFV